MISLSHERVDQLFEMGSVFHAVAYSKKLPVHFRALYDESEWPKLLPIVPMRSDVVLVFRARHLCIKGLRPPSYCVRRKDV